MSTPLKCLPFNSTMSAEPVLIVKDHAKRHQDSRPPPELVKALGLSPEVTAQLYVSDSQSYSNGAIITQLHYMASNPTPELQKYRGVAYLHGAPYGQEFTTVCKSYPYEDPIVADTFPEAFANGKFKFSISRQGFLARVFCPFDTINISTHRKIDCANSVFGTSIPMKEMFAQACEKRQLDLKHLFNTPSQRRLAHIFFVQHEQLRVIPQPEVATCDLIYLGSMRQNVPTWAEDDDDSVGPVVHDMTPCSPEIPLLEALRPAYHDLPSAQNLFAQGVPLIAWPADGQLTAWEPVIPTRLVPTGWDRKEKIMANTTNTKLAWYTLLDSGRGDDLREVLEPSQYHLIAEYQAEMEKALDGTATNHGYGPAPEGSLIAHLIERYQAFLTADRAGDREFFLKKAGKATGPLLKTMESYGRKIAPDQRPAKLTALLRKMVWEQIPAVRIYTLLTEQRKFVAFNQRIASNIIPVASQ